MTSKNLITIIISKWMIIKKVDKGPDNIWFINKSFKIQVYITQIWVNYIKNKCHNYQVWVDKVNLSIK